jgi:hypothetical protein
VDAQQQARLLEEHRGQILARTTYLDGVAVTFRFDRRLDDDLPSQVRHGIERRLARLRELAASVQGYAVKGRWSEAWTAYEHAERVAVDADHWIARGRAEAAARRAAKQRALAGQAGSTAKRRTAQKARQRFANDKIIPRGDIKVSLLAEAKVYRRRHPDHHISGVIKYLKNLRPIDESEATIRRYLREFGVK